MPPRLSNAKTDQVRVPQPARGHTRCAPSFAALLMSPDAPPLHHGGDKERRRSGHSREEVAISLQGVYGWRGRNAASGVTALGDWEAVASQGQGHPRCLRLGRRKQSRTFRQPRKRLARFLKVKVRTSTIVHLPGRSGGAKQGVDDFFVAGGTVDASALPGRALRGSRPSRRRCR